MRALAPIARQTLQQWAEVRALWHLHEVDCHLSKIGATDACLTSAEHGRQLLCLLMHCFSSFSYPPRH